MNNAKFKLSISRDSNDKIRVVIGDETSKERIAELKLSLEQFANVMTGMVVDNIDGLLIKESYRSRLNKEKVTKNVFMERPATYSKKEQSEMVLKHFKDKFKDTDWILLDDGCNSQQRGEEHKYTIGRYE